MAKKKSSSAGKSPTEQSIEVDFESSLAEVEQIVASLEGGELDLTQSLSHYEKGVKLLKECHQLLEAAEQRVSLLSGFDADGNPIRQALQPTSRRGGKSTSQPPEGTADPITGDCVDDFPGLF